MSIEQATSYLRTRYSTDPTVVGEEAASFNKMKQSVQQRIDNTISEAAFSDKENAKDEQTES